MKKVLLKTLPKGTYFKRKVEAKATFIKNHYNRKSVYGSACFSCSDTEDMNREIFLNPLSNVFVSSDLQDKFVGEYSKYSQLYTG